MSPLFAIGIALALVASNPEPNSATVSPEQAIERIRQCESQWKTTHWTVHSTISTLRDISNSGSVIPEEVRPYTRASTTVDWNGLRFRTDIEAIGKWREGVTPFYAFRRALRYDGLALRTCMWGKQGVELPSINEPPGPITSPPLGEIIAKTSLPEAVKDKTVAIGMYDFPPYFHGDLLSNYLESLLANKRTFTVAVKPNGNWVIQAPAHIEVIGAHVHLWIDHQKGGLITRVEWSDQGKLGLWEWMVTQPQLIDNKYWVPKTIETTRAHSKRLSRQVYSDVKINEPVRDEDFVLAFPKGTLLTDNIESKRYVVGPGVVDQQKAVQDYLASHALRASPTSSWLRWLALVGLLVGMMGLTAWWFRSRSKKQLASLLILLSASGQSFAAEQDLQGTWITDHGGRHRLNIAPCGLNVGLFVLEYYQQRYELKAVSASLPPTEDGVRFSDLRDMLIGHGLHVEPRTNITLADVSRIRQPDALVVFPVKFSPKTNHYLLAVQHPQHGWMVADPPHRAPIPLSKVADNPLVQPIGGAALIVLGRSKPRSPQADAISFHPARVDLGNLPGTGWEASKLKHHHVEVTNTSDHPVVIRSIKSTCGCLLPMTGLGILRPKESRKIPFAVLPGSWGPGDRHQLLMLTCADESTAHLRVDGRGIVPDDVPGKEQGLEP